jgi:amidase
VWGRTATELAAGIRAREFSAREVVEAHLARIEAVNPRVNAIVTLDAEGALRQADAADAREPAGVLHGLPIAVKDLEDTAGLRTTYGSPLFADNVPDHDSLLVERLRAAGAIIVGKTNTPEFGAGSQTFNAVFGATRNPWDLSRTPGGSSGGAAAAVASGLLPFADGSDLGASVRNPAAFCSLVGLRPSPGVIPDAGPGDPWNPLPVLGPIARTVEDVELLLSALAGHDPRDPLSVGAPFAPRRADVRGLRVAWSPTLGGLPVEPAVTAVLETRRATLEALGCIVEPAEPSFFWDDESLDVL